MSTAEKIREILAESTKRAEELRELDYSPACSGGSYFWLGGKKVASDKRGEKAGLSILRSVHCVARRDAALLVAVDALEEARGCIRLAAVDDALTRILSTLQK